MAKLPCPPELWPAFSALLDEALEIPDGARQNWLDALGAEHAEVRPWLVKVLGTGTRTQDNGFLRSLVIDEPPAPEFVAGQLIGPYQLKKCLGSGGMGEVWLASRSDGTLTRQVALKLPHMHLLAGVVRRRFERERDMLAALAHPRIAHLYDAGVDDAQNPYLAMEYVDGVAINDYCRDAKVSLERRLNLFLQVLDAVGHAHGRFIAHRDLKPSNILVTAEERVKLLDFGIAKLLDGDAERGATQMTRVGACMATPAYAAPEQLAGEPITVAVDLYALGVILHEMLTGQRPYRDNSKSSVEHTDPSRASARIESDHADYVGGLNTKQLRQAISGDLDAIIAKALAVDPTQRYVSAEAFAEDIRRSRDHRPISAVHLTRTTLALKFMRRHWLGATVTTAFLVMLIGGSAGIAWQAIRAEREAQRATTIKDFLIGVFRASDPRIAADKPRGEITARELLDISAKQIKTDFILEPSIKIELLEVAADIYRELDETKSSGSLYAEESSLARRFLGESNIHVIDGLLGQAESADADGDDGRALKLLDQADPLIRKAHLEKSSTRARWLMMRGEAMLGNPLMLENAKQALVEAAKLFESTNPHDPRLTESLTDLGSVSLRQDDYSEAAAYYKKSIELTGTNHELAGNLLLAHAGLALALKNLGDFAGAAHAFERGTRIAERTYGRNSHNYWLIASDWARLKYDRGERIAALAAFEDLIKNLPQNDADFRNSTDAVEVAQVFRKFGHCLAIDGNGPRSIELLEHAKRLLDNSDDKGLAGGIQLDLAVAYDSGGHAPEARNAFTTALGTLDSNHLPTSTLAAAREKYARFLLSMNRMDDAFSEFSRVLSDSGGHLNESTVYAKAGLAAIALSRGEPEIAVEQSNAAMRGLENIEGSYDVRIQPYVWGIRAQAMAAVGKISDAQALARRRIDAVARFYAPDSPAVLDADALAQRLGAMSTRQQSPTVPPAISRLAAPE